MSTDLELRCREHGEISDEVGNAFRNIAEVREAVANRKKLRDLWLPAQEAFDLEWSDVHWMQYMRSCLYFVVTHADCDIEIFDEYGKHYDLTTDPVECWAKIIIWPPLALGCMRDAADHHTDHIHENPDVNEQKYKITWRASKPKEG